MRRWRWADPSVVRAHIATEYTRAESTESQLGDVLLRDHQREAACRLRTAIEKFGGALLADDVGLGKTYTALAAARDVGRILVVAPAALAAMWSEALARSRVSADFVSFEALSRAEPIAPAHAIVIIDEAHHARNPLTRRYARLAELTRNARVLLLTATPVHNACTDLDALLALFLGSRAERLSAEQRTACIVRRTRQDVRDASMPQRTPPVWLDVPGSPALLQSLLDVPAPCPPRDGGDGGALVTLSLVRAWASTDAALRATLRRRIARAHALADALTAGRHPTRSELRAWIVGDDATQLAFPELMVASVTRDWSALSEAVARHVGGLRRALALVADADGRNDDTRCAIIRDIRVRHAGARIVVFSQFADSVRAMFERLRSDPGVCAVTADGAWIASGVLSRTEALARFSAGAITTRSSSRAQVIDLLLATDLLSEGLNLQDASVVVHLDLPWTAARLTQRMGRIWRMESPHDRVHEYALAPPASAERVLRIVEVLSRKAGAAATAIGEAIAPLLAQRSGAQRSSADRDATTARESLQTRLGAWLDASSQSGQPTVVDRGQGAVQLMVAAVRAATGGWMAIVHGGTGPRLIVKRGDETPTADPRVALAVVQAAQGGSCVASPSRVDRVLREIDSFLESSRAAADAGVTDVGSRVQSAASSRITAIAAGAPPHRRVVMSRLAASAHSAVARSRTAGNERLLRALVSADFSGTATGDAGEAWLERVIDLGSKAAPNAPVPATDTEPRVEALIVLVPERA